MHASTLRACALLVVAALWSCESSTDPTGSRTLSFGATSSGTVGAGDTLVYPLEVPADQPFVVVVEATRGSVMAVILDPSGRSVSYSVDGPATGRVWTRQTATTAGTYLVRVTADVRTSGGDFVLRPLLLDPKPEHVAPAIRISDTVSGESLDGMDDVDDFYFDGVKGQPVELFLQPLHSTSPVLLAQLYPPWVAGVPSPDGLAGPAPRCGDFFCYDMLSVVAGPSNELEAGASGRAVLPATGRYRLRIEPYAYSTPHPPISYRVQVYGVNRAPEHAAVLLVPGDTIESESIDHVGDVDEFLLRGAAGSAYNIFAVPAGPAPRALQVEFVPDTLATMVTTTGVGDRLLDAPLRVVTIPPSGEARVRVSDVATIGGLPRGPYRLLAYPIDRQPEHRASQFVASGTTILDDGIDQYGDVDEYRFTLADSAELVFRSSFGAPVTSPVPVRLVRETPSAIAFDDFGKPWAFATTYPAGSYRLTAGPSGDGGRTSYRGGYQLAVARIDNAPEQVPATVSIGDTISAEGFRWPVDRDYFHFSTAGADTVVVALVSASDDPTFGRALSVVNEATGAVVDNPLRDDGPSRQTRRLDLEAGGRYAVRVGASSDAWRPGPDTPYRLTIARASSGPEHSAATLAIGDTLHEVADYRGDIDEFLLRGSPGDSIYVAPFWQIPFGYVAGPTTTFTLVVLDPATHDTLAPSAVARPVAIPTGGALLIRILAPPGEQEAVVGMPYTISANRTSRGPEQRAAAVALGDTISGESIDYRYDVDEYTLDATAGQVVGISLQLVVAGPLQAELVDQTTGASLGTLRATQSSLNLDDISSPSITLPRTGRYVLRVSRDESNPAVESLGGSYRAKVAVRP